MAEPGGPATIDAAAPVAPSVRQAGERRSARIESLRALAALGVLVGHAFGWSHGYAGVIYGSYHARLLLSGGFGVFLFFTLSGYLLYLPFARHAFAGAGGVDVRRYAVNRALRVLPLYYVVVATYLAVNGGGLRAQWWRFALFLENFSGATVGKVDGPVWSLVVEVQFYALLPLFAWLIARASRRSLRWAALLVGALGVAAFLLRLATVTTAHHVSPVWRYSLPATAVFFVPGFLLAMWRVHVDAQALGEEQSHAGAARQLSVGLLGSSTAWLAAGFALWLVVAYNYKLDVLMLPASALLLGACALPLRAGIALRLLDLRMLAGLGAASYSLYLWHEPIVHALSGASWMPHGFLPLVIAAAVVCCVVAVASYRIVEVPFLRLRRSWSPARLPEQQSPIPFPADPAAVDHTAAETR